MPAGKKEYEYKYPPKNCRFTIKSIASLMNRGLRKILLLLFVAAFLLFHTGTGYAQNNPAAQSYKLELHHKDTIKALPLKIPVSFATLKATYDFINKMPAAFAER